MQPSSARTAACALAIVLAIPALATAQLLGPTTPTNVEASAGPGAGEATLAWNASESLLGVTAYRIYRGVESGNLSLHAEVDGNVTSFVDAGLEAGGTYHYAVSAVDATAESALSDEVTVTAFDVPSGPRDVGAVPGPGAVGDATVTWTAPESDGGTPILAYVVYRDGEAAATLAADARSWTDSGLTPLHDHHYAVSALNAVGEGAASAAACTMASPWVVLPDGPACLGLA